MENKNTDNQNTNNNTVNTTSTTTNIFIFGIVAAFKMFLPVCLAVVIFYLFFMIACDVEFDAGIFFAISIIATICISFGAAIFLFCPNGKDNFEASEENSKSPEKFNPNDTAHLSGSSADKFASSCDSFFDADKDGKLNTFEQSMKNDFFCGDDDNTFNKDIDMEENCLFDEEEDFDTEETADDEYEFDIEEPSDDEEDTTPLPGSSVDKFASSCDWFFDADKDGELDTFEQMMKNDFFWGDDD
jgi:hypothetical protein